MLNIMGRSDAECRVLQHGPGVFHEALRWVKKGEALFHVEDPKGEVPSYDLAYTLNMKMFPEQILGLILRMTNGGDLYAPFLAYDEDDVATLCLEFFSQYEKIELECVDEYSITVARLALLHTQLPVVCADERILWFLPASERLSVVESLPSEHGKTTLRVIAGPFEVGYTKRDWTKLSSVAAFQNLFFWQALAEGKKGPFKYTEVVMSDITGIGGLLAIFSMVSNGSEQKGYQAFLRPGCTRYPDRLLCKYFKIEPKPEDATEENTIVLKNLAVFNTSWYATQFPANFDESILSEEFAAQMREYADAVLGEKKTLGVLARGTDYVTNDLGADRRHATAEQMIDLIRRWMEEDGYEKIFLATEDLDNYNKIRAAFPGQVIVVSQERHSVSEMQKKNALLIYEFERKLKAGQDYEDTLEDTTINYFYALYLLARCDAFLCSGQCNGWDTVLSLNGGKFKRTRKLMVAMEGDPAVETWKEVRPVTAGLFARGAYPTSKAFFMTYRFDLAEAVHPEAVRTAWEKTLKVYPYFRYAVSTRGSKLVFLENPLPFVIKETGEVVEPWERSGNFHTVTFCYLSNVLWLYVDHVPTDGTGFQYILETFFYHYYCELDQCAYPVPAGVLTEKDGPAPGQEVDAYLMADAIDPKALMAKMIAGKQFVPVEAIREEIFLQRGDCRGYCVSVPSAEMMAYAKAVQGSPFSVLNICLARAMEKVHPENKLPIAITSPISVRKVMGNTWSLLHQVVHATYRFEPAELADEGQHARFRAFMKGYSSEESIRMLCGVYRGICEGYAKAFSAAALDSIIMEQRLKLPPAVMASYVGTLRTGDYGSRIRMTAFHAMQEKSIMLQMTEVGGTFYIDWYQGFAGESYAKALRDVLADAGMKGVCLERVE